MKWAKNIPIKIAERLHIFLFEEVYVVFLLLRLSVYEEDGRDFTQVGKARVAPNFEALRADVFLLGGQSGGHTEARLGRTGGKNVGKEPRVAVGRLDEQLRLALLTGTGFELFEAFGAQAAVDGQIAVEGKALPVEARGHHGQQQARRPDERHHAEPFALGNGHDVGTRVGHGRTTGFADDAHAFALAQWGEEGGETGGVGVLPHLVEGEAVDVDGALDGFEETAGGTDFFDNEVADAEDDLAVVGGQHLVDGGVAERDWDEVESGGEGVHEGRNWLKVRCPLKKKAQSRLRVQRSGMGSRRVWARLFRRSGRKSSRQAR